MRIASLVALSLALAATGAATAQELATVEVKAEESDKTMVLSCTEPNNPSLKEVEHVLGISDPAQSPGLRTKLLAAASEACEQKTPHIVVTRGLSGSLTWKAAES